MALEIREMIVRTTLIDTSTNTGERAVNEPATREIDTEYIIEQCIARIMEIIEEENEK